MSDRGGFRVTNLRPDGTTYKVNDFLATDWQMWEQNESNSFYFNDAKQQPRDLRRSKLRCVMRVSQTGGKSWRTAGPTGGIILAEAWSDSLGGRSRW